jgi:threonine dehydratase
VTHSSGNHAQALALASKLSSTSTTNVKATIVMPHNAPSVKKNAVQSYGATIVEVEPTNEARQAGTDAILAKENASNNSCVFLHPSEDPSVIAGQGTVSVEFVDQLKGMGVDQLDAIIIPVGGGGLASGNIIYLRGLLGSKIKIILAEPETLNDAKRSFESKTLLKHDPSNTLQSVADGLKTTLGPNTWPIIRDYADDIITVSEYEILRCTKLVWERLKVMIEPSAGVGVAVAQSEEFNTKYAKSKGIVNVGIILCGGNVDVVETSTKMKQMGL